MTIGAARTIRNGRTTCPIFRPPADDDGLRDVVACGKERDRHGRLGGATVGRRRGLLEPRRRAVERTPLRGLLAISTTALRPRSCSGASDDSSK